MTGPRVAAAATLIARIAAAVEPVEPVDGGHVTVTGDVRTLDRVIDTRPGIVLVTPAPALRFPALGVVECDWKVILAAGPADDDLEAWGRLDVILEALRDTDLAVHMTEAAPAQLARPDNPAGIPAYELTLSTTLDDYA